MPATPPVLACLPQGKALLGLSGGRDSVALLHLLLAAGQRDLVVCHLNHCLRGREADADAAFTRSLAAQHALPCVIGRTDVRALAKKNKLSIETAARHARLAFFLRLSRRHGTREVLLAHHADDQAETILGNVMRGCGLDGLAAMRVVTDLDNGLRLLRPLLQVRREAIDHFLTAQGISYREDRSNASPEHRRNRLRHEALPLLNQIAGRDVVPLVNRLGLLAAQDEAFLAVEAAAWLSAASEGPQLGQLDSLRDLHPAVLSRVIGLWLRGPCHMPRIGFDEISAVMALLRPNGPSKANLPGGHFARRRAGRLRVE